MTRALWLNFGCPTLSATAERAGLLTLQLDHVRAPEIAANPPVPTPQAFPHGHRIKSPVLAGFSRAGHPKFRIITPSGRMGLVLEP